MSETAIVGMRARLERILADPTPDDLWELDKDLLDVGGAEAAAARPVVRSFHACLRNLDSKTSSRSASRWGAVLGTAAVGSVSLQEMLAKQDAPLRRLLDGGAPASTDGVVPALLRGGVPALLEVGSAVKSAQAWEVEARLMYDEVGWFLWEQLWDISGARGELSAAERRSQIDQLLEPVLDPGARDADKAAFVLHLFAAVLAARLAPLLDEAAG